MIPTFNMILLVYMQVRAGDASLAAPFTSKKPSIAAVLDAVRQGRFAIISLSQL